MLNLRTARKKIQTILGIEQNETISNAQINIGIDDANREIYSIIKDVNPDYLLIIKQDINEAEVDAIVSRIDFLKAIKLNGDEIDLIKPAISCTPGDIKSMLRESMNKGVTDITFYPKIAPIINDADEVSYEKYFRFIVAHVKALFFEIENNMPMLNYALREKAEMQRMIEEDVLEHTVIENVYQPDLFHMEESI